MLNPSTTGRCVQKRFCVYCWKKKKENRLAPSFLKRCNLWNWQGQACLCYPGFWAVWGPQVSSSFGQWGNQKVLTVLGFSVSKRRRKTGKIGASHRIQKDEAMKWFQQKVRILQTGTALWSHVCVVVWGALPPPHTHWTPPPWARTWPNDVDQCGSCTCLHCHGRLPPGQAALWPWTPPPPLHVRVRPDITRWLTVSTRILYSQSAFALLILWQLFYRETFEKSTRTVSAREHKQQVFPTCTVYTNLLVPSIEFNASFFGYCSTMEWFFPESNCSSAKCRVAWKHLAFSYQIWRNADCWGKKKWKKKKTCKGYSCVVFIVRILVLKKDNRAEFFMTKCLVQSLNLLTRSLWNRNPKQFQFAQNLMEIFVVNVVMTDF